MQGIHYRVFDSLKESAIAYGREFEWRNINGMRPDTQLRRGPGTTPYQSH